MKDINEIKTILETYKLIIKGRFKIKEIGIFGSFVRGEETVKSYTEPLRKWTQAILEVKLSAYAGRKSL